jgi:hypothetical protein
MAHHFQDMHLRNEDGSGRGEARHVSAVVARVFPDRYAHDGAEHQHIWIEQVTALDNGPEIDGPEIDGDVFVAIRVTEGGIGQDIPFEQGHAVEIQGDWIPAERATAGQDDPGLPVLHFTHKPVGFVRYDGHQYD